MNDAASVVMLIVSLTLIKATPLIYAALAGVISERSGVINIGLEGMMVAGAFTAVAVSGPTGSVVLGIIAGIIAGALFGLFLGILATKFRVDQIVAGTGINLIAIGGAAFALVLVFGQPGASKEVPSLEGASWILIALAFASAAGLHGLLYYTPWGLRVRACGENPHAVAAAGLNPLRTRIIAVTIGGALAGLGGAYLSVGELNLYSDGMVAGRGFIALAAVIFGRWTPFGATGAAIFFGLFEALQFALQRSGIPNEAMQALPYIAALVALAGLTGRVRAPAADGVPY
ncbi:MAG: ABC transporter permease [Candidatus Eremiobacteraeota bacterium]|nr:ABC transporter permease [Candidatus Eremiobacteraeota bacterium]